MEIGSRRPLAVVTGGSSGIGRELARQCIAHGFDLVLIADGDDVHVAAGQLGADVASVFSEKHDLATREGVEAACKEIQALGRPVDVLILNAGVGVTGDFAGETDLEEELRMIRLNCDAVVHLAKRLLPGMVERRSGRVLITSDVAGSMPAPREAVYCATKAFELSFAEALRGELQGSGVTVTVIQPEATDTDFFRRGHAENTRLGQLRKDDPALVARQAFTAMMHGKPRLHAGSWRSRLASFFLSLLPEKTRERRQKLLMQPLPR
jgi:short-subunit dehydrogenase